MSKRKLDTDQTDNELKKTKKSNQGHWATGLLQTMENPKYIVKSDNLVTVIKDAYPKAEFHYLVLPKLNISNLKALTKEHVNLLIHMEKVAKEIMSDEKHKHKKFKLGYHAEASMLRLHLHIISDDMNSKCLKTKKHWNSFNTEFFLDASDVLLSLQENGKVNIPTRVVCRKYMETPLKCHKCHYQPKNIPDLKKHILVHLK